MARLLTVPISSTGIYWGDPYSPSLQDLQILAGVLSGVNAAINQAAETFPVEYDSMDAVLGYVESGGIYVDYCGWPMFWTPSANGSWQPAPRLFGQFLTALGADQYYCDGFDPTQYNCSSYPRDRGWLTKYNISSQAGLIYGCPLSRVACASSGETIYGAVAVRPASGRGIYFYGAAGSDNAVDPTQFGQFILSMVQAWQPYSPLSSGGSGGTATPQQQCQAAGNVWYDNECLTPAEYQCIISGGTWKNGVCQPLTVGTVPPVQTAGPNWPLIIGAGVTGIGLIVGMIVLFSGGE